MSILANKDTYVVIQGGVAGVNAARRMAEFCYLIKRSLNVLAFVYPPDAGKTHVFPTAAACWRLPSIRPLRKPRTTIHRSTPVSSTLAQIGR